MRIEELDKLKEVVSTELIVEPRFIINLRCDRNKYIELRSLIMESKHELLSHLNLPKTTITCNWLGE